MATIRHLTMFQGLKEKVSDYLERVSLYFVANGVDKNKQVAVLLTAIGEETYALLTNLLSQQSHMTRHTQKYLPL